jgi:hypothetical protein
LSTGVQEGFKMIIINFFGGPGSGKSTTAAGVFSLLKLHGVNCEYVPEFAKDLTWEDRHKTLENQLYIFAKQQHRLWRLIDKVDIIVTDAPLIQGLAYINYNHSLTQTIVDQFNEFENMNFFLMRTKEYNPNGRSQTEEEAKDLDGNIAHILVSNNIKFTDIDGDLDAINIVTTTILNNYGNTLGAGGVRYKIEEVD